ncbi:MAG: Uncharacterized protein Greene071421_237 [Parcubacteria group bacterium Greene0714_21]|nr:MAG: Uncharacterized protein Greene041639_297 [Parcubacteria group bacterium Greene0416_39]TSC97525.1 MAG: Uncharacterized protein Greene101447_450 [Parcubacteria group bacterium Greene1014_47]TSD04401.1 MAG: Uncharacterized protein Greene071421_237 [Parcubacteria group bacterium Greene0714_21]
MEPTHSCKALVLHCIDFRFQEQISEFLGKKFPQSYDRVVLAGGVKELLENGERSITLKNLEISSRLHQPKIIVLIQHEDCGAYGGSKAFGDFFKEQEFQNSELKKAEALLKQQFSQPVEKYLVRLSGEITSLF